MLIRILLGVGVALLVAGALPARAGIYRWTDDAGVVHFTSDPMQVPPRYRGQEPEGARPEAGGSDRSAALPANAPPARRAPAGPPPAAPPLRPGALEHLKAQTRRPAPTVTREMPAPGAAQR